MSTINRRVLLQALGATSLTALLEPSTMLLAYDAPRARERARKVVVARPGENRFPYASPKQAERSPCKVTSADSLGAMSIFELKVAPNSGPARHVHHREDEWCYVSAGDFLFEAGGEKTTLSVGGSILMPRDIPHVWANTSKSDGKLIVVCQPGGFEKFFDELGKIPDAQVNDATVKRVMAKYGMELLGPPLLGRWRSQS